MNMMGNMAALRNRVNQLMRGVLRMRRHEADPIVAGKSIELLKQLCKRDRGLQRFPVGIDILTKQCDFLIPCCQNF